MRVQALILALALCVPIGSQARNYARQFGSDWSRAAERVERHRAAWEEVFSTLDVDATECEAIVFPEQLRFSRLQDGMEQTALLGLYVTGGKEKANFSIGLFQMKPSFAEQVEAAWMKSPSRHTYRLYFDLTDNREQRRRRLERITDERWQCVYLALFVRLMDEREPSLKELPGEERIRLLATAYNMSFTASLEELQQSKHRKTFHTDLLASRKTRYYEYAGIAVEWYKTIQ
ncbi:hypothetical protein [Parabacteroides sp.]